ncbi:CoA transferase [Schumannella soli]|uniref:Acyl-CoA transferase n=1 Tax=Schumannella soli TaxID=2590779 RepID=A0A506Y2Q0_9MICO|nr:CoA transferase [Schumannella soli]TPW75707.1 acyl-CoA transferase [Schumannella soli]
MDAVGELGLSVAAPDIIGPTGLASAYPVSELAVRSVGAAGAAVAELLVALGHPAPHVTVRRELAEAWFRSPIVPVGWTPAPAWDALAGDYRARDGWLRLHTNAPHHRAAALRALGLAPVRDRDVVAGSATGASAAVGSDADADAALRAEVERRVAARDAGELEAAVVAEGGAAAQLRTAAEWAVHPQGVAVAGEPLVARVELPSPSRATPATPVPPTSRWAPSRSHPLAGLRVLDLTRVLAGPTATQLLAGLGAEVLRIDPPDWDEPGVLPIVMSGKRSARLDARTPEGAARLRELLAGADVLVHGLRPRALDGLGLDLTSRHLIRPGLVEVQLDAYGFNGPWAGRRGFDSLVQLSTGLAETGMRAAGATAPVALPVQALDVATGYLAAAAVMTGLAERVRGRAFRGRDETAAPSAGSLRRLSLARTALELERMRAAASGASAPASSTSSTSSDPADLSSVPVSTGWGPARRLAPPIEVDGVTLDWPVEPGPLGRHPARWSS